MVHFRRPFFRRSIEVYVHHSGFGGSLLVNAFSESGGNFLGRIDISEAPTEPLCFLTSGRHVLMVEFYVPTNYPAEKLTPSVAMAFDAGRTVAKRRLDIHLSPSKPDSTIHARFVADSNRVLFDGETPISHADEPETPFVVPQ